MARSRPADLPGTAGVVDDGAPLRGRAPVGRRLSVEAPACATAASAFRAGRRGRRRSRGNRTPQPRAASPGYPGIPEPLPSRKPARTASRKSRNCESRNPGSGRRTATRLRPVIPDRPDRPRPGSPPAPRPANPASANPAIPDPGTAPARRPARLSRNARSAPVPEARPHRIPQIPQPRTRNPVSGRCAGRGSAGAASPP